MEKLTIKTENEIIPLQNSAGRFLAQDVSADRDQPPFNRAAMDGIAVRSEDLTAGISRFTSIGTLAAGQGPAELGLSLSCGTASLRVIKKPGECVEIMTGAAVPDDFDSIIPYEVINRQESQFSLPDKAEAVKFPCGKNIHIQGSDYKKGKCLLPAGTRINTPSIALLAAVGIAEPWVYGEPRISIISTGNELVPVDDTPQAHQIRQSNIHVLRAELSAWGFTRVQTLHSRDDEQELTSAIRNSLRQSDVLILSGGISKGVYDLVPEILQKEGVRCLAHGVTQRPGKPLYLGTACSKNAGLVVGLPGNPVSSLINLRRYVVPFLGTIIAGKQSGSEIREVMPWTPIPVKLSEEIRFKARMTYFPAVYLRRHNDGVITAAAVNGNGSGDFYSISRSHGFLELPAGQDHFEPGYTAPCFCWGPGSVI
ncbi:MAG: molybdopterin molybdotransferase MoeA [Spirochaetales bacterium]|nr:molybdopterin molybdotransferase MoeA [Spirochaetales bacterium]